MGNVPAWQLLLTMTDQLGTPPAHADEGSAIPLAHAGEGVGTVSVRDAAKSIGVSERTIRRRIQDGILSAWKQETEHGYEWRVPVSSLDAGLPGTHPRQNAPLPGSPDEGAGRPPAQHIAPMDTQSAPEMIKALDLVDKLQTQNQDLWKTLEHWQARAVEAEQTIKLLMAPKDEPVDITPADDDPDWQGIAQALEERVKRLEEPPVQPERRPWWKRWLG